MAPYDLRSLSLPKLTGAALTAFAAALDNPLTRPLLMPSLLKQGGFDRFHALRLDEPPATAPAGSAGPAPMKESRILPEAPIFTTIRPTWRP